LALNVETSVDSDKVEMGSPINLRVVVTGQGASLPEPTLPDLSDFDVYSSGRNSSFSMINGAFSSTLELNYTLIPKKTGNLTIGPVVARDKNTMVSSDPIKITVSRPGTVDHQPKADGQERSRKSGEKRKEFFIEQSVDNRNPYVGEQVTLVFKFYQAVNLWGQPTLEWPEYIGITVEDLPPIRRSRKHIDGKLYQITEIKRALFPLTSGKIRIESPRLTIKPDDFGGMMDPFGFFDRDFFRRGKPRTLTTGAINLSVRPLPAGGRPESFDGAVGRYGIEARVDKDSVGVDEPISLRIKLSGSGDIKSLSALRLPELGDFRVYESGQTESINQKGGKISGSKTFELALIPRTSGSFAIPSLEYSFFNPSRGAYEIIATEPIEILATGEGLADVGGAPKNVIEAAGQSYGYIITGFPRERSAVDLFGSSWFWILQGMPVFALVAALLYRSRYKKLIGDRSYAKRINAGKRSRKILRAASAEKGASDPRRFFGHLYDGVLGFVADRLGLEKAGLTLDDIRVEQRIREDVKEKLLEFLEGCQNMRFTPQGMNMADADGMLERANRIISELQKVI
jgi:hypothetical protein